MNEKESINSVNEYERVKALCRNFALDYGKEGNFEYLLEVCKSKIEKGINPIDMSLFITDVLSAEEDSVKFGNKEIIDEALSNNIKPRDNYRCSVRIEALSCLIQILENFEE